MVHKYWPLPLLNLRDLLRFIFLSVTPIKNLFWVKSSSNSIAIISDYITKINQNKVVTLYLPAYFCGNSLRNVRALSVNLSFYPILNFQPDYNYIESVYNKDEINIFLFVHYFGKITGQVQCQVFCRKNNFFIIEDCAHIANIDFNFNWIGDFVIFSPHKHYPIPEIGIIMTKRNLELSTQKLNPDIIWYFKQFFRSFIKYKKKTSWGLVYNNSVDKINDGLANGIIVKYALSILKFSKIDLNQKLINLRLLQSVMSSIPNWEPLIDFSYEEYPYIFGYICENEEIAKKRFDILNRRISLVLQWTDLPFEVENLYFNNRFIVNKTIFFVLHGRINKMQWVKELNDAKKIILESEN